MFKLFENESRTIEDIDRYIPVILVHSCKPECNSILLLLKLLKEADFRTLLELVAEYCTYK